MNVYRLRYREQGCLSGQDFYNVLAENLETAFIIGNKEAAKTNPGMLMECTGAEEIARDVIAGVRAIKKAA